MPQGTKVLIVLDQFEQWLHSKGRAENTELVQAIRQCDGGRVQCIVMVRDDFWLGVSRFLRELEVPLIEGRNIGLVDLFDVDHAQKVTRAFGRAYGRLPEKESDSPTEANAFLDQAVNGLAEDGKIVCVRLALFAEMMKGKQWTPATLIEVGGPQGVGVTFLEETFSATTASPEHRFHQKAARAILAALLPQSGTHIKGNMRSYQELLETSGYSGRPTDFEELIRILDSEIRLITPTDPEGTRAADDSTDAAEVGQKYYQLTHDYLVHSLRDWLTRKQRETRRGRAELRLQDRAALWNEKRENRHLPSLWEFLNIRQFTNSKHWTAPERQMIRKAGRVLAIRSAVTVALVIAVLLIARQLNGSFQARSLVKRLATADESQVAGIVAELDGYRRWADPLLREEDAKASSDSSQKLRLDMGLLPVDPTKRSELRDRLPGASAAEFVVVRDFLPRYVPDDQFAQSVTEPLWDVALGGNAGDARGKDQERFQAACALASYAPEDERWSQIVDFVARRLVTLEASALVAWRDALRPVNGQLIKPLSMVYRDKAQSQTSRIYAAETLTDFAANHADELFDLLVDAELFQFPVIFEKLAPKDTVVALARERISKKSLEQASQDEKDVWVRRQTNAAVCLFRLGDADAVWPLLKHSSDPSLRSMIVDRLPRLGADPGPLANRLRHETDSSIRQALILTLGDFDPSRLPKDARQNLLDALEELYRRDPDPGVHSAAGWSLRQFHAQDRVKTLDGELQQSQKANEQEHRRWFVNSQGQTFVLVEGPVEFLMDEAERVRRVRISRRFAVATHEVTLEQFQRFRNYRPYAGYATQPDCPALALSWFDATAYCNWLSQQEGLPQTQWCYEANDKGDYVSGMKIPADSLQRTGYRLPTDSEWEYVCRANTTTRFSFGEPLELLPRYGWSLQNSEDHSWPVGSLRPNAFGLFDVHGNVFEWCKDRSDAKGGLSIETVTATHSRVLRGGAFVNEPRDLRSAYRYRGPADDRGAAGGFRLARTYP